MNDFNLQQFIVMIVIVGVTLVVGIYISDAIGQSTREDVTYSGTNTNETLSTVSNVTASSFAILSTYSGASCTLSTVVNATGGEAVASANYTQPTSCTLILVDASGYIGEDLNVTYTYSATVSEATDSSDAADDVVDALATGTAWISILVVVGFATIVLSMLTTGLGAAARESEVPYY